MGTFTLSPEVRRTPVRTPARTPPLSCRRWAPPCGQTRDCPARSGGHWTGRGRHGGKDVETPPRGQGCPREREGRGRGQMEQAVLTHALCGSGQETGRVGQPRCGDGPLGKSECPFPHPPHLGGRGEEGERGPFVTPSATLQGQRCPHFTDGETEAGGGGIGGWAPTAGQCRGAV